MARLPRLHAPGQPLLILQRGQAGALPGGMAAPTARQTVFVDEADYRHFIDVLRDATREHRLALHAYVLMPDHFHLLVTPDEAASPAATGALMQTLGRRYVQNFNRRHSRSGTLWDGRYKSTLIEPRQWLLPCTRYIELNPVRAQLVSEPALYPWSSYTHHAGYQSNPLLTDHAAYWALGNTPFERQTAWRSHAEAGTPSEELHAIRNATNKGWALASAEFIEHISVSRRATPMQRGRPVKRVAGQG